MPRDLALVDNGEALPGRVSEIGYVLPPAITRERWVQVGATVQRIHRMSNWLVGDWYLHGERMWGEEATQAIADEYADRADESLRQAVWVAEQFPLDFRQPRLSWTHHRIAGGLPAPLRYEVLKLAAAPARVWTTRELQDHINSLVAHEGHAVEVDEQADPSAPRPIHVPDLTEAAIEALVQRLESRQPHDVESFNLGWIEALRWQGHKEVFTRWED